MAGCPLPVALPRLERDPTDSSCACLRRARSAGELDHDGHAAWRFRGSFPGLYFRAAPPAHAGLAAFCDEIDACAGAAVPHHSGCDLARSLFLYCLCPHRHRSRAESSDDDPAHDSYRCDLHLYQLGRSAIGLWTLLDAADLSLPGHFFAGWPGELYYFDGADPAPVGPGDASQFGLADLVDQRLSATLAWDCLAGEAPAHDSGFCLESLAAAGGLQIGRASCRERV